MITNQTSKTKLIVTYPLGPLLSNSWAENNEMKAWFYNVIGAYFFLSKISFSRAINK